MPVVSFQSIPILIDGHDTAGCLALVDGQLAAVLARLDRDAHPPELKGRWHLEAGFGLCGGTGTHVFATLDDAGAWVQERLNRAPRVLYAHAAPQTCESPLPCESPLRV